jgi:glycosyltransferase involved in cell wall biosynthesis
MAKKQNKVKICLWTHVQNEASIIKKMLESAVDYIDYWVLVDNGSTDGTQDIIKKFFEEHKVKGKLYQSEIGWKGHGINRQHSWDFLKNTKHNCDYILRIDADEAISVDDDFDWTIIPSQEAWTITYQSGDHCVPRMWMWKWGLPWYWADDVAHETIHLEGGRVPYEPKYMPLTFKHISLGGGNSYENPIKYIQDILKLENQLHERFKDGTTIQQEKYHLFYLGKSYNYTGYHLNSQTDQKYFPYGKKQLKNFLEKGIFYHDCFLDSFADDGEHWYVHYLKGQLLERLNKEYEAIEEYKKSYSLKPSRSESLYNIFKYYYDKEDWENTFIYGLLIKKNKCPIETDNWQIELNCYYDNNWIIRDYLAVALERIGSKLNEVNLLKQSNYIFKSLYEDSGLNLNESELDRLKKNIEYVEGKINEEKEN